MSVATSPDRAQAGTTGRALVAFWPGLVRLRRRTTALAVVGAALVIGQAALLATALAGPLTHAVVPVGVLVALAAVFAGRALVGWLRERWAQATAEELKCELRQRLTNRIVERGPVWLGGQQVGALVALAGRGLDGLEAYLVGYLPQVAVAVVVPAAVTVAVALVDWPSAVVLLCTLPLIPLFGALSGAQVRAAVEPQWRAMRRLAGHFLDVVHGLPTLRLLGRAEAHATVVARVANEHAGATLRTLRAVFAGAMALELVATFAVALVAVPLGLRLLTGGVGAHTAFLVLLLAPEAFLPLRLLGTRFHASMDGLAAARQALDIIAAEPMPPPAYNGAPDPATAEIRLEGVTVRHPGRPEPALEDVTLTIRPGETVAVAGPSGAGKTTLLHLLLGFVRPQSGRVLVGAPGQLLDLNEIDITEWRRGLGWLPQRPYVIAATVADNIRLAATATGDPAWAARLARADEFVAELPGGYATRLSDRGTGLAAGQRQRLGLARVVARDAPILLLDEPTAHLDGRTEAEVLDGLGRHARGRTVVLVSHRPAALAIASRLVVLDRGRVVADRVLQAVTR